MENKHSLQNTRAKRLSKKTLFIITGVLVFSVFCIFFLLYFLSMHILQEKPFLHRNTPLPNITRVILTDNGFSPSEITIKKGTAVQWENDSSSASASVNSDEYPTNKLYPGLNLGKFNKGSTIIHVFTSSGNFTYHNQFNPQQTGKISVE